MSAAIALPEVIAIAAASNTFLITHLHAQTEIQMLAQSRLSGGFIGPFTLNGYESLRMRSRAMIVIPKEPLAASVAADLRLPCALTVHLP
jgi:hypothetical protein